MPKCPIATMCYWIGLAQMAAMCSEYMILIFFIYKDALHEVLAQLTLRKLGDNCGGYLLVLNLVFIGKMWSLFHLHNFPCSGMLL